MYLQNRYFITALRGTCNVAPTTEAHKLDKLSKEARELKIQEWRERSRNVAMPSNASNITLNSSLPATPERALHNVCSPSHEDSLHNSNRGKDTPRSHGPKPLPNAATPCKGVADLLRDTDDFTRTNHRRSVSTVTI